MRDKVLKNTLPGFKLKFYMQFIRHKQYHKQVYLQRLICPYFRKLGSISRIYLKHFRNMHNVTNMFICSVSFADFILIILATPFQAKVKRNPYSILYIDIRTLFSGLPVLRYSPLNSHFLRI